MRIRDKEMDIVPFRYNFMQRDALSKLTGRDLFLKSRQLGVTSWAQAEIHHDVTLDTASSITLSDNTRNTKKIRAIYNRFHDQWPQIHLGQRPLRAKDSEAVITYPATDSESVIQTAGAKTAGRGGTYSHVHGSEVAFWQNTDEVLAGVLQAATANSRIFLESTPNGAQGMFYEMCMQAANDDSNWRLHFYPWWWGKEYATPLERDETITPTPDEEQVIHRAALGGFTLSPEQIKWRRLKQNEPGMALLFGQEYPEDLHECFLSSGLSIFGNVEGCLKDTTQEKPDNTHRYVGGLDWGQTDDYTSLSIIDATVGEEVFVGRWRRMSPETVLGNIIESCVAWNVEKLRPELNSIGWNYVQQLVNKIERTEGADISVGGFETNNVLKRQMADNMGYAMRNDLLKLLKSKDHKGHDYATGELRTFVQTQTKTGAYTYGHIPGAKDDTVIARMAAWDAACNLIW